MAVQQKGARTWRSKILFLAGGIVLLYAVMLIPDASQQPETGDGIAPFVWNQDQVWASLEAQFQAARTAGCGSIAASIDSLAFGCMEHNRTVDAGVEPETPVLDSLEQGMFLLAAKVAACPEELPQFLETYSRMRTVVKHQSQHWDISATPARARIYRLLYGGRAALDEILLQLPVDSVVPLLCGEEILSATPSDTVIGMVIHSGDILVSRGGAPTSALIARGNDFPGNFSHIALVCVPDNGERAVIIESHIERGVVISSLADYLHDTKLRIMLLRPRPDLPQLVTDPLLPHRAARAAFDDVSARHIPYDFAMDYENPDAQFCAEVASAPYRSCGLNLWRGGSTISSPVLRAWLYSLGIRHFLTQEPADLEYDPQLAVVAEWRDPETLYKDHLDNAVIEAMLDLTDSATPLAYNCWKLPLARAAKGYSAVLNQFGKVGPIPEGMSATVALRVQLFSATHERLKERLVKSADKFFAEQGYRPPYWVLVRLATEAYTQLQSN